MGDASEMGPLTLEQTKLLRRCVAQKMCPHVTSTADGRYWFMKEQCDDGHVWMLITFIAERTRAVWILLVHGPALASTSGNAMVLWLWWRTRSLGAPNCLCSIGVIVSLAMEAATFVPGIALWVACAFAIDRHANGLSSVVQF
eukprot:m51a1_g10427 hypothetical protein (143) ;mRNA; r:26259-26974